LSRIIFDRWGFQEVYLPDDDRHDIENYREDE
jgi:hypothetical protein